MRNKKFLILLLLLVAMVTFYFVKTPSTIPYDLSEVSKMRKTTTSGDVGTLPYRFVLELNDGNKLFFIQNTSGVISLYSDKGSFNIKIKAQKT